MACVVSLLQIHCSEIDEQAYNAKQGINAGADALKRGLNQAPNSPEEAADEFQRRAARAADEAEGNLNQANRGFLSPPHAPVNLSFLPFISNSWHNVFPLPDVSS